MRSGLYGLFNLDGAPVEQRDRAMPVFADRDAGAIEAPSAIARAMDAADPAAVASLRMADGCFLFAGYLNEREELAETLGLSRETPAVEVARAALDKYGDEAPLRVVGEWSAARWREDRRELVVTLSQAIRDDVFFTRVGQRVAIAPDIHWLRGLNGGDRGLDAEGLLFNVGRLRARSGAGGRTIARGVGKARNGSRVVFNSDGSRASTPTRPPQPERFRGTFEDALAEADALMARIGRERFARADKVAFLLSGGLDSSLTTWLGASQRQAGQDFWALSSASPANSDIPDETGFAEIVTNHLGMALERVAPPLDANPYCLPDRELGWANGPALSPRHYLYTALFDRAAERGARKIVDGCYGEMTLTGTPVIATMLWRARQIARGLRNKWRGFPKPEQWPEDGFHVRLSPGRLANIPASLGEAWKQFPPFRHERRPGEPWGYHAGVENGWSAPTEAVPGELRVDVPFRDMRLLRLCAGFPAVFFERNGQARALARGMLENRLPDTIRLRPKGTAFSPDYYSRLRTHADSALARIPDFRAAGVDEWLDLDWLAQALVAVRDHGAATVTSAFEAQLTAMMAEQIAWWNRPKTPVARDAA